ncbi:MAG: CoA transferase [Candidatus Tectomicrobia bacterium]|uniref:CoA transferase n=1 Tax=Tectimicrobiota bacterium TaxID=2528274 RepID=A0A937W6P6_UNCTE|nr:CoA transferase [Candidatus Tectomicrobia bacterium]
MAQLALEGLRVLDLTQVAVGPYTTLLLGFMGAEVLKVESCSRMDISRGAARPTPHGEGLYPGGDPGERPWDRTGHYVHRNGNKLSVTLDLATPRGKELLLQLVAISDVLVENFRATVMDRLGLGYEALAQVNPRLIYLKISSQGATGPERDYGSLGSTLEQTAGLASITGYKDGKPLMTNETFPDPVVGMLAVGVLMAALRQRRQTGQGTFVDLAQREVTVAMLGEYVVDHSRTGRVPGPLGNRHPHHVPQGVYPCLGDDMWVALSIGTEAQWRGLCQALGQPGLAHDPRFATLLARRQNQAALDDIINTWTRAREHRQAMHLLQAHGVPAGAVLKGGEVIVDPHLEARGFWDVVHHPEVGPYRQVTTPWHLSQNPRRTVTPSPSLGEHNTYVLGTLLGLSSEEMAALEAQGIIGTRPLGAAEASVLPSAAG